jgi:hypothetical protein
MVPSSTNPIRQAIACREYRKARKLCSEYMAGLRAELQHGALTAAQMEEARELLEWARVNVLCCQAHIQNRLRSLQVAGVYGSAPLPPPRHGRLRVSG